MNTKNILTILGLLVTINFYSQHDKLIDNGVCIYGDCFDSFGMISNYETDQYYIGEFKEGKFSGYGLLYSDKQTYLANWLDNKKLEPQLVFSKLNSAVYKGNFFRSLKGPNNGKLVQLENNYYIIYKAGKPIKNQFSNFNTNYFEHRFNPNNPNKRINLESLKRSLTENQIKIVDYYNQNIIYFREDFNTTAIVDDKKNIIIGYLELGGDKSIESNKKGVDKIFYLGETKGLKIGGKGLWVTYIDSKIIDVSYSNLENNQTGESVLISKSIDDQFISYAYIDNEFTAINSGRNITAPPKLIVQNLKFSDDNSNNLIEANESSEISFTLSNQGMGPAYGVSVNLSDKKDINGLIFSKRKYFSILKPDQFIDVKLSINSNMNLITAEAGFEIDITEGNGFDLDKIFVDIQTQAFIEPSIEISDYQFISDSGVVKNSEISTLQLVVQNTGQGIGENIKLILKMPNNNVYPISDKILTFDKLLPGESKQVDFKFTTNNRFDLERLVIKGEIVEKYNRYGKSREMSVKMGQDVSNNIAYRPEVTMDRRKIEIEKIRLTSNIDVNIPVNSKVDNRYALIIGNEDYKSYQTTLSSEQNVDYAVNDATVFKNYALNTLGVKDDNMFFLTNATAGQMSQEIERVSKIVSKIGEDAELIVYYAGHGYPDEINKVPYLIPVDISASNLDRAIKLDDFYTSLSSTNASKITVFLDACFTGGGRSMGLYASRGIKVRPKTGVLKGNLVVFSASSSDQSSLPYHQEKHGMFTYHLLKKIQETKGDINLGELSKYLEDEVSIQSLKVNKADQEPTVNISNQVTNQWKNWRF